jgi:polyferredoxin
MTAALWLSGRLLAVQRVWVQLGAALVTNSYFPVWLKHVPCPGLNCYSCPAAVFACPIGSLQHFAAGHRPPLYVAGVVGLIGLASGRLTCGWLCPFGLLQDLAYRLPTRKWSPRLRMRWLPFVFLVAFVLVLPFLTGEQWFSKICPAGTLEAGLPWLVLSDAIRSQAGWFFVFKVATLGAFLVWMVVTRRPWCRTVCPLGAIYALFNPIAAFRLRADREACSGCDRCQSVCPVDIDPPTEIGSLGCIHCLECVRVCPSGALHA